PHLVPYTPLFRSQERPSHRTAGSRAGPLPQKQDMEYLTMSSLPLGNDDYPQWDLPDIVSQLRNSREVEHKVRYLGRIRELPSREMLRTILDGLAVALFPTHYGRCVLNDESIDFFVGNTLNTTLNQLWEQIRRALFFSLPPASHHDADLRHLATEMGRRFARQLPEIR